MAKRHTSIVPVGDQKHIGRVALFSKEIERTFLQFGVEITVVDVKLAQDSLSFLFMTVAPVRMQTLRSFEPDLQYELAHEDLEIIAPLPDSKLCAVVVYMNVSKVIFDVPEIEGIPSPWNSQSTLDDELLYGDACKVIRMAEKVNEVYLQRKLKIGYMRATYLIKLLEERGIIGPAHSDGKHEIIQDRTDDFE